MGAGIADVRAPGRLPRQRLGGRARMDAGLHDRSPDVEADRPQPAAGNGVARVLHDRAARRRADERVRAAPVHRRARAERVQRDAVESRAPPQAGVPVRHARDDAAGGALRHQRRETRRALRRRPRDRDCALVLDPDQRVCRDRQGRPPDARARRVGAEHPRRWTRRVSVPARARPSGRATQSLASRLQMLLQGRDEVARENAVPVALAQHPLRNLTGHRGVPAFDLALARHHRDERPYPPLHEDRAFPLERVIRVLNRVGVHLQLARRAGARREADLRPSAPRRRRTAALRPRPGDKRARVSSVDFEDQHPVY